MNYTHRKRVNGFNLAGTIGLVVLAICFISYLPMYTGPNGWGGIVVFTCLAIFSLLCAAVIASKIRTTD